jgi:hypothetical protein
MTAGLLQEASGHPRMQGFVDAGDPTFSAAEANEGFIARSLWPDPDPVESWGEALVPKVFQNEPDAEARNERTLSLWRDLESAYAFAYSGPHAEAMIHRREWFIPHPFPGYVLWRVADDHIPTWREADEGYSVLCQEGATAEAFDFNHAFDADGQPTQINREVVRGKMERKK